MPHGLAEKEMERGTDAETRGIIVRRRGRTAAAKRRMPASSRSKDWPLHRMAMLGLGAAACWATACFLAETACGAEKAPLSPERIVQQVREYRKQNENRIMRELTELLAIPNVASDTENIQKNAEHLVEMLEARGIATHLFPITGRGPVVFGKLEAPDAKRTVIFYAHYDGQPVDAAAWTDGKPFD